MGHGLSWFETALARLLTMRVGQMARPATVFAKSADKVDVWFARTKTETASGLIIALSSEQQEFRQCLKLYATYSTDGSESGMKANMI
jgi:hypothetical protein